MTVGVGVVWEPGVGALGCKWVRCMFVCHPVGIKKSGGRYRFVSKGLIVIVIVKDSERRDLLIPVLMSQ